MKMLQVHDGPYAPTSAAFGVSRDAGIDGVVLDLNFDDGSLTDSSGSGQVVEVASGTAAFGDGVLGTNAFQFDGNTVLRVAASDSLNLEGGLTQASWVFLDPAANAEMNIMEKGQWSGNWLSHLKVGASSNLQDGEFYFAFASSQFQPVNVDDNVRRLPTGTWVHVAMTWDGTHRKVCSPKLTVAFSHSSYILMTYRVVGPSYTSTAYSTRKISPLAVSSPTQIRWRSAGALERA